jgi:GNAT superfamily N-acetyltransferase
MTPGASITPPHELSAFLAARLQTRPIGLDDFSDVRYLHATALNAHTATALSGSEIAAFVALVYSPQYSDILLQQEVYGAWLQDGLVGTAAWHIDPTDGRAARIGPVFVAHPQLGIGRHLIATVEARAGQRGFREGLAWATANAVPFFARLGYQVASRGVKSLSPACQLPVTFMRKSGLTTATYGPD